MTIGRPRKYHTADELRSAQQAARKRHSSKHVILYIDKETLALIDQKVEDVKEVLGFSVTRSQALKYLLRQKKLT